MAEKAPSEDEEASRESSLDQFLRRLDQSDQEATTSGASMAPPASDFASLATNNPWFMSMVNPASPINPDLQISAALHGLYRSTLPSVPYTLPANPLAEFPWLLEEFDHQRGLEPRGMGVGDPDSHDSSQRYSSSYTLPVPQEGQLGGPSGNGADNIISSSRAQSPRGGYRVGSNSSPSSSSPQPLQREAIKDEPSSSHTSAGSPRPATNVPGTGASRKEIIQGHAGSTASFGSSSKYDAGPVPRFERTISSEERSVPFGEPTSQTQFGASSPRTISRQNYRPPTSPLLSEAAIGGAGGSVTTSAGTSNTSVSSESTSNAGDEDEAEKKEGSGAVASTEGASSGKRKKPDGEESSGAGETESKKAEPKNKPRKRGSAKRLREPRYAIKTRTDVDVLDDGFKWRKYGQKAVKNSPHPRNYYRCTTPNCPVRKRVERSNEDSGLVITTYEGTHTHQTPGFHRPTGGYFGDRPLGMGGGLFQSPLGPAGNLLPLPPGFDLASLQQATALRNNIRGLQPNQSFPGSSQQQQQINAHVRQLGFQQENLFRAQQFLGLQDPAFGSSIKQEPYQFTAQDFVTRNISLPQLPNRQFEQPGPGITGSSSQLLNRSISEHSMQRPALFPGLNFPSLQPGPASLGNSPREHDSSAVLGMNRGQGRHELVPAGVGGSSSSRIDQSLETLVSGRATSSSFDQALEGAEPQLGSGLDPITRASTQSRAPQPPMQHNARSGAAGGLRSSSENLQRPASESSNLVQPDNPREGLLQDMVRHGGPKVSKS